MAAAPDVHGDTVPLRVKLQTVLLGIARWLYGIEPADTDRQLFQRRHRTLSPKQVHHRPVQELQDLVLASLLAVATVLVKRAF